jgi:transposase-like protein
VSHVSVYNWIIKFAPYLCKLATAVPLCFTKLWHVDEKFIKIRYSKDDFAYLWIVSDDKNNILATHVSFGRDTANAKIVLRKAKERAGFCPEILVSDGLPGYKSAVTNIFGRKTRHVVAHFKAVGIIHRRKIYKLSNNRAEAINRFYALWLHACKGFKRLDNARLWIEFFTINYNYLMPWGEKGKVKVRWEKIPVLIKENIFLKQI